MRQPLNPKKIIGVFYGALIAVSYLTIKNITQEKFLLYFTCGCFVAAISILPFLGHKVPRPLSGVLIRGLMYASSNFLILAAQQRGTTASSLSAALIGSMFVSLPSLIKPVRFRNFLIISCLFFGIILLYEQIKLSYLAVISGIIQAVTFTSASKIMRVHQIPILWNMFIGFVIVSISGGIFLGPELYTNISTLSLQKILIVAGVVSVSQIAFFRLYKAFPIEAASRYSLGRIPWAYAIDAIFFGKVQSIHIVLGAVFLSIASFARRERRSSSRPHIITQQ